MKKKCAIEFYVPLKSLEQRRLSCRTCTSLMMSKTIYVIWCDSGLGQLSFGYLKNNYNVNEIVRNCKNRSLLSVTLQVRNYLD